MKVRSMTALALLVALLGAFVLGPFSPVVAAPLSQPTGRFQDIPITGTILGGGTFTGTLDVTRFVVRDGELFARGLLSGTLFDILGNVIGTVADVPVLIPINIANATCEILQLDLGPLHLDLLGLVVDLSAVHLDITAVPGAGNLLGNLLCAIANLLNDGGPLSGLAALLNRILRLLG